MVGVSGRVWCNGLLKGKLYSIYDLVGFLVAIGFVFSLLGSQKKIKRYTTAGQGQN